MRGLYPVAIAAAVAYYSLLQPFQEAQAGKDTVSVATEGVFLVPLLSLFGVGRLVGGGQFYDAIVDADHKPTKLGYVAGGIGLALGFGLHWWFKGVLRGLGYEF